MSEDQFKYYGVKVLEYVSKHIRDKELQKNLFFSVENDYQLKDEIERLAYLSLDIVDKSLDYVREKIAEQAKISIKTSVTDVKDIESAINNTYQDTLFVQEFIMENKQLLFEYLVKQSKVLGIQRKYPMNLKEFDHFIITLLKHDKQWKNIGLAALATKCNAEPQIRTKGLSKVQSMTNQIQAYNTIAVSSMFVFTYGISIASFKVNEVFRKEAVLYLFHILITISIGCSFHALFNVTFITYNVYRFIGIGLIDAAETYLSNSYKNRRNARICFLISIVTFVLSLAVLYYDKLPIGIGLFNTIFLTFAIVMTILSLNQVQGHKNMF